MHAPYSAKKNKKDDAKNSHFCATSRLRALSLFPNIFYASIKKSKNYKFLRFISTTLIFFVANLPIIMLMAISLHLPFQGMQADFMIFFILVCELLILCITWKLTGFFTKRLMHAQKEYVACIQNLEETQKLAAIGRLASSVNHEINNPLAIINEKSGLAADLLEFADDFPSRDRFTKIVDSITKAVGRCQGISQRMLHFSRRKEAVIESIDINALLTETASFLERETRTRGVTVLSKCHPNLPCVMSERGPLQQVFLNIFTNALAALGPCEAPSTSADSKGNPHAGEMGFTTDLVQNTVLVTIHDTGSGMTDEVQKRLFEPFFSTKGDKGTGLGMYICQSIISRLGGSMSMESTLGQGTRFTISIPVSPLKATPISADAKE